MRTCKLDILPSCVLGDKNTPKGIFRKMRRNGTAYFNTNGERLRYYCTKGGHYINAKDAIIIKGSARCPNPRHSHLRLRHNTQHSRRAEKR
jgi:hypothetical protein